MKYTHTAQRLDGLKEVLEFQNNKKPTESRVRPRSEEGLWFEDIVWFDDNSAIGLVMKEAWSYSEITPGEPAHVEFWGLIPK